MSKYIIPFAYFGSKFNHLNWLLPKLPDTKIFVDVFGGSGVVILNKSPTKIEIYNDLDSNIYNFFKILRDSPKELKEKIYYSPYSRKEYYESLKSISIGTDLERARKFYVVMNQSFSGSYKRNSGWKMSTVNSRTSRTEALNRYLVKYNNLDKIIERFRNIQITNYDFSLLIEKFDSSDTLFYCDPPYILEKRFNGNEYSFEMTDEQHLLLLQQLKSIKGKFALSCYDNDLYNNELKYYYKHQAKNKISRMFNSIHRETLYTNYLIDNLFGDLND